MGRFFVLVSFFTFPGLVMAQAPEQPPGGGGFPRPLDPVSRLLDTNQDGELSAEEIEKAPEILAGLDKDGDGVLSLEELLPGFPGRGPGGGPGMGPNQPEIKLADEFDSDENGYLDPAERKLARAALAERGGNRGMRGPGGMRGPAREPGTAGEKVSAADVIFHPDAGLYDSDVLRTVFIEFDTEDWEEEMAAFKLTDVEMPATVTVDGESFPLVGLKFRGQSSFSHIPSGSKRSLNLSMDLVDGDQRLYGFKTLNLLNCNGDPSFLSSVLYSQIAKNYLPVPRANFVKVVIHGESWGIYCNVEQFNKDFIKEHFGTDAGARWKVPGSPQADGGMRYLGDEIEPYKQRFEIKSRDTERSWLALVNLCRVLEQTPSKELPAALEPILNVDGLLRFLALDVATVNSDGYWTRASDYSLYLDTGGMFHVIPHDMNEAFTLSARPGGGRPGGFGPPPGFPGGRPPGGLPGGERAGPPGGNPGAEPIPGFGPPPGGGFGGPGGRRRGMRGGPGHGSVDLDPLLDLENDRMPLRNRVLAVPAYREKYLRYLRTIADIDFDVARMVAFIDDNRALIINEIKADTRKLSSFDAFLGALNIPLDDAPAPGNIYQFLEQRRTFLLAHEQIADLENVKLAPLAPRRPVVTSKGDKPTISINEILASNTSSGQDPQGDNDDWIELVNHGRRRVDLSGMFLSDDVDNPLKWRIPDGTVLEAGMFLVIWADEDGDEEGLHANFKLSKDGEVLMLVSGRTIVDKIEFEKQRTDISLGRLPNGVGTLRQLLPTPGAANRN
jgi:hypothetical protein